MRPAHLLSLAALTAVLTLSCGASAEDYPRSPAVRMWEARGATEGEVTVAGDPAAIYAAVTDYSKWTAIFPNLETVIIKSGNAVNGTIETVSRTGKRHTLVFKNDPRGRTVRFTERGRRADIKGEITFRAGARANETIVHARLSADVRGAVSLFVSEGKVRGRRQKKVMTDLTRIHAYFGAPAATTATPAATR
jgi:hypothetical protein